MLAARALTEGTERYDAIALIEASERLGASLHAEAGWDATSIGVDVPASRLAPALELLAEVLLRPTFPAARGRAAARRAAQRPAPGAGRPAAPGRRDVHRHDLRGRGRPITGRRPGRARPSRPSTADSARRAYERTLDPARATLVVAGDLGGQDVVGPRRATARRLAALDRRGQRRTAGRSTRPGRAGWSGSSIDRAASRPRSASAIVGLPRRIPDFHAVSVMSAILGGLFNSRLNMQLREAKGYTYGAGAGFDLRRGAGPFTARAAVNTEVTVPAVHRHAGRARADARLEPVTDEELAAARDFLVGVFPLRFETPGAVAGALAGLAVHGLPLDELIEYRARIEAVDVDGDRGCGPCAPRGRRRGDRARRRRRRLRRRRSRPPAWARSSSTVTRRRPSRHRAMPSRNRVRPTRAMRPARPRARRTHRSRAARTSPRRPTARAQGPGTGPTESGPTGAVRDLVAARVQRAALKPFRGALPR